MALKKNNGKKFRKKYYVEATQEQTLEGPDGQAVTIFVRPIYMERQGLSPELAFSAYGKDAKECTDRAIICLRALNNVPQY